MTDRVIIDIIRLLNIIRLQFEKIIKIYRKEGGLLEMTVEQLRLFNVPEKLYKKRKGPLYYVEIVETNGDKYIIWLRRKIYSVAQAKKVAAILYNKEKKFDEGNFLHFGRVEKKE